MLGAKMQKLSVVVLLLALCMGSHGYGYQGRELLQGGSISRGGASSRSSGDGGSSASVDVRSRGGRSSARARSDSRSFSKAKNEFVRYCEIIYNQVKFLDYKGGPKGGYCLSAYSLIDDYVIAFGKASASAFASSAAEVSVEGDGSACASSDAYSRSQAKAYAKIIGEAIAIARIGKHRSKAKASFNIVSDVLVQAFAESWASACQHKEGFASAYHTTHAKAVGYPIASVWIWLFAGVDCRHEHEFTEVAASGEAYIQTETSVTSGGDSHSDGGTSSAGGDGVAVATSHCRSFGHLSRCCSRRFIRTGRCNCRGRCDAELEAKVRKVWYDYDSKQSCHC